MWWIIGIIVLTLFIVNTRSMNRDADKKAAKKIMKEDENDLML
jgi:hypothetical protein